MTETSRFSVIKPNIYTPFHIDFEWWKQHDNNWKVFLQSFLCPEHQKQFQDVHDSELIDYIDPITAEVRQVDLLQHTLISHCTKLPDYEQQYNTVVHTIFRTFLVNGNSPLTPQELSERCGKSAEIILRTLSGSVVYNGIRPCRYSE